MTSTYKLEATYQQSTVLKMVLSKFLAKAQPPVSEQAAYDIWLAVHETFVNIVDHAYARQGGPVWLTTTWRVEGRMTEIVLRDNGRSFASGNIFCPDPGLLQEHGYGLYLVSRLVDHVSYSCESDGNCWQLIKYMAT